MFLCSGFTLIKPLSMSFTSNSVSAHTCECRVCYTDACNYPDVAVALRRSKLQQSSPGRGSNVKIITDKSYKQQWGDTETSSSAELSWNIWISTWPQTLHVKLVSSLGAGDSGRGFFSPWIHLYHIGRGCHSHMLTKVLHRSKAISRESKQNKEFNDDKDKRHKQC